MKKLRLATGVYQDVYGIEARVQVRGETAGQRFVKGTPLAVILAWQQAERKRLAVPRLDDAGTVTGGTLEGDLPTFLAQIAGRVSFKSDRSHLRAWLSVQGSHGLPLGKMPRSAIATEDVNLAIASWRKRPTPKAIRRITVATYDRVGKSIGTHDRQTPATSGDVVAVRTIRHRCRLLAELYHTIDGQAARTPVDEAKIPKLEPSLPVGVDAEVVRLVAKNLQDGDPQTYARFVVLATTGQRPCQVQRAQPGDVNLKAGVWVVRGAKGAPAHSITLNEEMAAAWRAFSAAEAWGSYDGSLFARRVHAAGWPETIRPYNLRHSVMIDALAAGVGLDDVQGLAGHTSPATTRRFYGPLTIARQRKVSDQLAGRFEGVFGPRKTG